MFRFSETLCIFVQAGGNKAASKNPRKMKNLIIALAVLSLVSCKKDDAIDFSKIPRNNIIKFFSSDPTVDARNVFVAYGESVNGKLKFVPASSFDCTSQAFIHEQLFAGTYTFTKMEITASKDTIRTPFKVVVPDFVAGCLFIDVK
jgi:hypothetical protein